MRIWCSVVLWLIVSGCGSAGGTMRVSGKVMLAGVPLADGLIAFIPVAGKGTSVGGKIKDGAYDIPAAQGPRGDAVYRIEISALTKSGTFADYNFGEGVPPLELLQNSIPAKYNKESVLRVSISSSSKNVFDFKLDP